MMRFLNISLFALLLFFNGGFAFVQDPIPPSTRLNYFLDKDEDGRMDHLEIQFLGAISKEYVDEKLDSLTVDWLDSSGKIIHIVVPKEDFILDTLKLRKITIDLSRKQSLFYATTGLSTSDLFVASYGACELFLSDGTSYVISLKDGMAPAASSYRLTTRKNGGADTLKVSFTEKVKPNASCDAYLEFKSYMDSVVRVLYAPQVEWSPIYNEALFIFDQDSYAETRLTARDSVRLLFSCVRDSAGNKVSKNAKFGSIEGFFPFELSKQNLVKSYDVSSKAPVFELLFEDVSAEVPNDTAWGYSIDVLGPEFEASVRNVLGMEPQDEFLKSKVQFIFNVRIYTNLGSFVANAKYKLFGNDSRFEGGAKKLFLRWNLMDLNKRRVSSGAYLSKSSVVILYDGKIVFNSGNDGSSSQVFGVLRR